MLEYIVGDLRRLQQFSLGSTSWLRRLASFKIVTSAMYANFQAHRSPFSASRPQHQPQSDSFLEGGQPIGVAVDTSSLFHCPVPLSSSLPRSALGVFQCGSRRLEVGCSVESHTRPLRCIELNSFRPVTEVALPGS